MKGTWDSERDPLSALRSGDRAPFEAFVRTEIGTFLGFFQRLGADRAEAEDLAQEVFLKLYRSAATYDPQSRFSSFALRVARNAWIDRSRRRAARPGGPSLDAPVHGDATLLDRLSTGAMSAPDAAARNEDQLRLSRAIAELPRSHAQVFDLAVLQGIAYAEISAQLGIPVGTVKSRVFNAVRKLRALLEEVRPTDGGVERAEGSQP